MDILDCETIAFFGSILRQPMSYKAAGLEIAGRVEFLHWYPPNPGEYDEEGDDEFNNVSIEFTTDGRVARVHIGWNNEARTRDDYAILGWCANHGIMVDGAFPAYNTQEELTAARRTFLIERKERKRAD